MTQVFKSTPVSMDLDVILRECAKDFKAHDGFEIISTDWYVDVHKNKVCFVVHTMKEEDV